MRRFVCAVAFAFIALPTTAQLQLAGTWEGSSQIVGVCGEPPPGTGSAALYVAQAGSSVFGTVQAPSDCLGIPIVVGFVGELTDNGFTGTALLPFDDTTVTAVVSGNTINISVAGELSFTLTRTSSQQPDTRLTGASSGSGTFTAVCSNGSFSIPLTISGSLIHANAISGLLIAEGSRDIEDDPTTDACRIVEDPFVQPLLFSGVISGSSITGLIIIPDEEDNSDSDDEVIPFVGSVSGNTISGGFSDSGGSINVTFTQTPGVTPPAVTRFTATPSSISPGQSSTLAWTTLNADSVTIDNGVGTRPASGSATVSPSVTTTYTLTATGPGGTSTATATITVVGADPARVVVTELPRGMVQPVGVATAVDSFTLTNLGGTPTNLTLTQSGTFFSQTPTSFTLAPGASQVVVIRANQQQTGTFDGTSMINGPGSSGLTVRIRLAVFAPPAAPVVPAAVNQRPDVAAPADQNPTGSVDFTNSGAGVLQGVAQADAPWLLAPSDPVVIQPGETRTITFMTNRALRPDGDVPQGGQTAKLSISYLDFAGSSAGFSASQAATGGSSNAISVSIVDVVRPGVSPGAPPALGAGERAVFAPALPQRANSLGDLLLGATGTGSISDLRLFLTSSGGSALSTTLSQLIPGTGISLPSILKNVFNTPSPSGTVQIRTASTDRVSVAAMQTNTASRVGSYITALPTFRSDVALAGGARSLLAGVEKSGNRSTNVFVQEVSGNSGTVQIDFLGPNGSVVGSRPADSIAAFGLLELMDAVPQGATVVRVTNNSTGGARIASYALVVDAATQDAWLVTDSTLGSNANTVIMPVVPGPSGSTTQTDLFLVNPGSAPLNVTFDTISSGASRRRATRTAAAGSSLRLEPNVVTNTTIPPGETLVARVTPSSGFVRVSAPAPFSISGRSTLTAAGRSGTFGSALPPFLPSAALPTGQGRRFTGVDDSAQRTIDARTPVTYRTSLGLVEAAGQSAVVRATLRYTFSAGTRTTAQGVSSKEFAIAANQLILVGDLSKTIIGAQRQTFGDLRNMQLDVEVIGGNGTVIPFLQVIDNGSADVSIRSE